MTFQAAIESEGLQGRYTIYQATGLKALEVRADELRGIVPALRSAAEEAKSEVKKSLAALGTRATEVYVDVDFQATNKEGRDAEFQIALRADSISVELNREVGEREGSQRDADAELELAAREWTIVLERIRNRRAFVNLLAGGNTGGTE